MRFKKTVLVLEVGAVALVVLWLVGPKPACMGPYVQNVTATSAVIACFDEVPSRVRVTLRAKEGEVAKSKSDSQDVRAHALKFEALSPHTLYSYRIEQLQPDGVPAPRYRGTFRTAPVDPETPLRFAAVGDSGKEPYWFRMHRFGWDRMRPLLSLVGEPGQWPVARWMARKEPDLFFHLGDVIYSHNQLPAYEEVFFRPFGEVLAKTPLVCTFGDHDLHTWRAPEFFSIFHTYADPKGGLKKYEEYSYSFVWGGVRFWILDAFYQDWQPDSAKTAWLEESLGSAKEPWKIVMLHHPVFTAEAKATATHRSKDWLSERLWPRFSRHAVDLVISGDSHSYQRFRAIEGVVQVIAGTGGKSIRAVREDSLLAKKVEAPCFLLVEVAGKKLVGEAWAEAAEPLDRFVIQH